MTERSYSLAELGKIVGDKEIPCGFCDEIIRAGDVDCWGPHDGGHRIVGYAEKQWVFFRCSGCGYDWSLRKITHLHTLVEMK